MPLNKRQHRIIFTYGFCSEQKSIEEMEIAKRFSPPLPVCRDYWKLLEALNQREIIKFKRKEIMMATAYCVKCRQKREIKDPKEVTLKNNRPAITGTCPVCGTKLFRIGKL